MPLTEQKAKSISINRNVIGKKDAFSGASNSVNQIVNTLPAGTYKQTLAYDVDNEVVATDVVSIDVVSQTADLKVDTTNFDNNLSSADDTLQKCLETIDEMSTGGTPSGIFMQTLHYDINNELRATDILHIDNENNIVQISSNIENDIDATPELQVHFGTTEINSQLYVNSSGTDKAIEINATTIDEMLSYPIVLTGNSARLEIGEKSSTTTDVRDFRFLDNSDVLAEIRATGDVYITNLTPTPMDNSTNIISVGGVLTKEPKNIAYTFSDFEFDSTTLANVPELFVTLQGGNVYHIEGYFILKSADDTIFRDGFKFGFNSSNDYLTHCNNQWKYLIVPTGTTINENDLMPISTAYGQRNFTTRETQLNAVNPIVYNLYSVFSYLPSGTVAPYFDVLKFDFVVECNETENFYLQIAKERDNGGSKILMAGAWLKSNLQSLG